MSVSVLLFINAQIIPNPHSPCQRCLKFNVFEQDATKITTERKMMQKAGGRDQNMLSENPQNFEAQKEIYGEKQKKEGSKEGRKEGRKGWSAQPSWSCYLILKLCVALCRPEKKTPKEAWAEREKRLLVGDIWRHVAIECAFAEPSRTCWLMLDIDRMGRIDAYREWAQKHSFHP